MKWTCAILALLLPVAAHATTVIHDTFDTENGGLPATNFNGLTTFEAVTSPFGTNIKPDLLFSSKCAGGSGGCIDLKKGAYLQSRNAYAFNTGDIITFTLQMRDPGETSYNSFEIGLKFPVDTLLQDYTLGGGFVDIYGPIAPADYVTTSILSNAHTLPGTDYRSYSVSFKAGQSGSVKFVFYDFAYNSGLLVDNASVTIGAAVPEPATWLLMSGAFGLVGGVLRRRGAKPALA